MKLKIKNCKLEAPATEGHTSIKVLIVTALVGLACLAAQAALRSYVTKSAGGNTTAGAQVSFVADPQAQIRVVSVWYGSDASTNQLRFSSGAGSYVISSNNAAAAIITVSTTNGLAANDRLFIQSANGAYWTNCTISSFPQSTNIIISLAPSFGTTNGDYVYKMNTPDTIPIGVATNALSGEAIWIGTYGRPVIVEMFPAAVSNRLNTVSVKYDTGN